MTDPARGPTTEELHARVLGQLAELGDPRSPTEAATAWAETTAAKMRAWADGVDAIERAKARAALDSEGAERQ